MDDEPMWAADCVVAPTPGSEITILETANEFVIKGNHLTLVKGNQFDGRIETDPHKHIYEFLRICDMFKYRDTKNEVLRLMISFRSTPRRNPSLFATRKQISNRCLAPYERNAQKLPWSQSDTDKIMARMNAMTMKMDAQYKELQSRSKPNPDHNDDDIPMSREEDAKFMQTFCRTRFYNDYRDSNRDNWRSSGRKDYN
ncbi:hypothetical protein Tco_0337389 [Tanacetum coccineum]